MSEKERSTGNDSHGRARGERLPAGTKDLARLGATLVKSPQWTKNTLQGMEAMRSAVLRSGGTQGADARVETAAMSEALARRAEEMKAATRRLQQQSRTLQRRGQEIDRLRQAILELENEKAELAEAHRAELDAKQLELSDLQAAYDQFEQQADVLLDELSDKNERLKAACKNQNRLSVL